MQEHLAALELVSLNVRATRRCELSLRRFHRQRGRVDTVAVRGDQTVPARYTGPTIMLLRGRFGREFCGLCGIQVNSHTLPGRLGEGWDTPPLQGSDMEPSPTSRVVAALAPHFDPGTGDMGLWHSLKSPRAFSQYILAPS